jgi:hypothetical protein
MVTGRNPSNGAGTSSTLNSGASTGGN